MHKNRIIVPVLAACMLLSMPTVTQAFRPIMEDWQAYYNTCQPLVTADCNACHQNGFDFNVYGEDLRIRIEDQGMTNTEAFVATEGEDSDGDGYTNGQEIVVDCTLPWDGTDRGTVPAGEAAWSQIKALFR